METSAKTMSILRKRGDRFIYFVRSQTEQIRRGGIPVLFEKLYAILMVFLAVPVVIVARLLRPWVNIRFGSLPSARLGHFTFSTELFLCKRDAGISDPKNLDIFYHTRQISNLQIKKMWDRRLYVCQLARWAEKVNGILPGSQSHTLILTSETRDTALPALLRKTEPHLSFTSEEEHLGEERLRGLGVTDGAPFVCFSARDSAYLDVKFADLDWRYQDYRDTDVLNCIAAVEELTRRGYFTIRMGVLVKKKLTTSNPKIIDYAVDGRSDFLDVYLAAKCRFFISDTSGLSGLPLSFRRPIAWINFIPIKFISIGSEYDIFIPKKLWWQREHRFLTFREIFDSDVGDLQHSERYKDRGIEVIENTPEEIHALAVEMDDRLNGRFFLTGEDSYLQRRFWGLFRSRHVARKDLAARIGRDFLRKNRNLLD